MNKQMMMLQHLQTIRVTMLANRIIFYAKRIPLIGNLISDRAYSNGRVKRVMNILALIAQIIWGFSKGLMFLGFMVFLPMSLGNGAITEQDQMMWMLHIMLWLSFVVSLFTTSKVLEPTREKYIAVKQMRIAPVDYMKAMFVHRYSTYLIYYLVPMIVFVLYAGGNIGEAIVLVLAVTSWRIIGEIVHLKIYERSKLILLKHMGYCWTAIIAGYVIAYGALLLNITPHYVSYVVNIWVAVPVIIGGLFAWLKLYRYSNYREVVDAATKRDDPLLNIGKMIADEQKKSLNKDSHKFDSGAIKPLTERIQRLKGYPYLNAIFMERHSHLFSEELKKRLFIIAGVTVLAVIAAMIKPELAAKSMDYYSLIVMYMYLVVNMFSVAPKAIYSYFYHCDVYLLGQSFYRQAAKEHYRIRLRMLFLHNGLIGAALSTLMTCIWVIGGEREIADLAILWVGAITYACFTSIHQLFMYYILQPYSADMKMKNPFYFLANLALTGLWVLILMFEVRGMVFVLTFVVLTIIYQVVSTLLVDKYGARTFRLK